MKAKDTMDFITNDVGVPRNRKVTYINFMWVHRKAMKFYVRMTKGVDIEKFIHETAYMIVSLVKTKLLIHSMLSYYPLLQ